MVFWQASNQLWPRLSEVIALLLVIYSKPEYSLLVNMCKVKLSPKSLHLSCDHHTLGSRITPVRDQVITNIQAQTLQGMHT